VLVVGGAGSLEVAPGVQLVDTPTFPDAYKPVALAHRAALSIYEAATDLDWTFFAPAAEIGPGKKRGRYRTQATRFLADDHGKSEITYADYADAFVDEIEKSKYARQVATVAY
jgi:putative NADH-flavin reductase